MTDLDNRPATRHRRVRRNRRRRVSVGGVAGELMEQDPLPGTGVDELVGPGEHRGDGAGLFGVALADRAVTFLVQVGEMAAEFVVQIDDAGPQPSTVIGAVGEAGGFEPDPDAGPGDVERQPVAVSRRPIRDPGQQDVVVASGDGEDLGADRGRVRVDARGERPNGGDPGVELADGAFGVNDRALLAGDRVAVGAFGPFEAGDGRGERGEFDVAGVAGGERGDLRELFGGGLDAFVAQVTRQAVGVRHRDMNEVGFALQDAPRRRVGGPFRDVTVQLDARVLVALADHAAFGLGEPVRPIRGGEFVGGVEAGLDVDPDAHLLG